MQTQKIDLHITDEVSNLNAVILGIATSIGEPRGINPKAAEAIELGMYPSEAELVMALGEFEKILSYNGVRILRPTNINNLNQIFVRDLGFVLNDFFLVAHMRETVRKPEIDGLSEILSSFQPDKMISPPEGVFIEGGDIVQAKDIVFVGVGRRTNQAAVNFLQEVFPQKEILSFDLNFETNDPRVSILHLDCTFQPVGSKYAILYENGFISPPHVILDIFGEENIIKVSSDEMYQMVPNILSLSPSKVVSCKSFIRLNRFLSERGINVITITYEKVSILGGLLRCSTLPLNRNNT